MTIKRYDQLTKWERKEMWIRVKAYALYGAVWLIALLTMNMTY